MSPGFVAAIMLAASASLCGCASIQQFDVQPYKACPGESVTATWLVDSGSASITAQPPLPGLGEVPATGTRTFDPTTNTTFVLTASALFKDASRELEVTILPASQAQLLAGIAHCAVDGPSVTTDISVPASVATPYRQVVMLQNGQARAITITKDQLTAMVEANGHSDAFRNVSLPGTWSVSTQLQQGESCPAVLEELAFRLLMTVQLSCGGQ
ncbi:MAG TPA: hypothetical protein VGP06_04415 [Janthinobacterium sp.]|jgi:ABC-type phosphate/phosphonate transport system substrate-binding protein|nr:hypothetical protein [Janthinobacterium sp.]